MDVPTIIEALTRQIRLHEARAGRRAVSVCVALPVGTDVPTLRRELHRVLQGTRGGDAELDVVVVVGGEPRVLTLDFEAADAGRPAGRRSR